MNPNLLALLYSLLLIAACIGIASIFAKKSPELARKIVHIGVAQWYFIYVKCFTDPVPALIGIAAFAVLDLIMNLTGFLGVLLGQKDKKRNWGLVWYPVSIFVMIVLNMNGIGDQTALGVGLLGMGWGDGLAALIGSRFGKHKVYTSKTWEGSLTFFVVVTVIAFLFTRNLLLAVICGIAGAVLELFTPYGLDNLTVPLGLYGITALGNAYAAGAAGFVPYQVWPWPMVFIIPLFGGLAFLAVQLKHLTDSGAIAAFAVGVIVTWSLRFEGLILLALFFVSSNLIGRIRKKIQKARNEFTEKKGSQRDHIQVIANGLMASAAAILFLIWPKEIFLIMFGASVAEAASDTWAGEIGRLSRRQPVSMKTGKPVQRGISGGVTGLGFVSGFGASLFIALMYLLMFPSEKAAAAGLLVCLTGFAGCVFDSFLGAFCQALYRDAGTGELSEKPMAADGTANELVQGIAWMDNDMVNILSNAFSALLALLLGLVLFSR